MVTVEVMRAGDADEYDAFVRAHEGALFYHSLAFASILRDLLGCTPAYLVARDGAKIAGIFPVMRSADGALLNSLPYYGSNGGVLAIDARAARALVDAWDALAAEAAAATVIENPFAEAAPEPRHTHLDARYAHVTSLGGYPGCLEPSARRNLRKAQRSGFSVAADPSALPRVAEIHHENIVAMGGLPKSGRFFELVEHRLEPGRDYEVYAARRDGDVAAGLLLFYWGTTVEYYTPAIDARFRSEQPLALVLDAAMRDAASRGCRDWNWGGTWRSQESLRRFKRKWGAGERDYHYFTRVNDPALLSATPADLRARYPGFYVAPYAPLATEAAHG